MPIVGTIDTQCPACQTSHTVKLVQSINTHTEPEMKERLMKGQLNVLVCACGKRTQLLANVLYHDPEAAFFCHVCPGDISEAAQHFRNSGAAGRIVPSLNALVEKVKILEAGLQDWAVEMTKVLLVSSLPEPDLNRVLLFNTADAELLHWLVFDAGLARPVASPRKSLVDRADYAPAADEYQIDRAWAVDAVRRLIWNTN